MKTVRGYTAERLAPVKRYRDDDGPLVLVLAPTFDVGWLSGATSKKVTHVERDD